MVGQFNNIKRFVFVAKKLVNEFSAANTKGIETVFHEFSHKKQDESIRKGTVNELEYMMAKERLIVKKFPRYYGQNYNLMFMEVDARLKAAQQYKSFIESLEPNILGDEFQEIISKCNATIQIETENLNRAMTEKKIDGKPIDINKLTDEIIQEEIQRSPYFLKQNPVFLREYNLDGTKRQDVEKSILEDAVHTTEEQVRIGEINGQVQIIKNNQRVQTQEIDADKEKT